MGRPLRMQLCRDKFMIVLRVPFVINSGYAQDSRGTAFSRPLRYRIQAMNGTLFTGYKNTRPVALGVGADL